MSTETLKKQLKDAIGIAQDRAFKIQTLNNTMFLKVLDMDHTIDPVNTEQVKNMIETLSWLFDLNKEQIEILTDNLEQVELLILKLDKQEQPAA